MRLDSEKNTSNSIQSDSIESKAAQSLANLWMNPNKLQGNNRSQQIHQMNSMDSMTPQNNKLSLGAQLPYFVPDFIKPLNPAQYNKTHDIIISNKTTKGNEIHSSEDHPSASEKRSTTPMFNPEQHSNMHGDLPCQTTEEMNQMKTDQNIRNLLQRTQQAQEQQINDIASANSLSQSGLMHKDFLRPTSAEQDRNKFSMDALNLLGMNGQRNPFQVQDNQLFGKNSQLLGMPSSLHQMNYGFNSQQKFPRDFMYSDMNPTSYSQGNNYDAMNPKLKRNNMAPYQPMSGSGFGGSMEGNNKRRQIHDFRDNEVRSHQPVISSSNMQQPSSTYLTSYSNRSSCAEEVLACMLNAGAITERTNEQCAFILSHLDHVFTLQRYDSLSDGQKSDSFLENRMNAWVYYPTKRTQPSEDREWVGPVLVITFPTSQKKEQKTPSSRRGLHFGGRGYPVKNHKNVIVTHGEDRRQGLVGRKYQLSRPRIQPPYDPLKTDSQKTETIEPKTATSPATSKKEEDNKEEDDAKVVLEKKMCIEHILNGISDKGKIKLLKLITKELSSPVPPDGSKKESPKSAPEAPPSITKEPSCSPPLPSPDAESLVKSGPTEAEEVSSSTQETSLVEETPLETLSETSSLAEETSLTPETSSLTEETSLAQETPYMTDLDLRAIRHLQSLQPPSSSVSSLV
eukprot:CAMPEP_0114341138 /NCGR_PEP_ID=MMETSP0101-20121206/8846_1 /TAXON_ID=38822 ORGANISM="Pteridomonas danica, Strain PT" /NCGR_SAMPLE_ID=MMETSP0101 /ASSEMBLY_ACC=CAM_ASM_000211 /LENGTH=680 /DNA_ID=CAMNT_0001474639 /DNA_START=65 /DNA_END=2107 /DNA_ORIENTATION=+